jgi:hypothetical protein
MSKTFGFHTQNNIGKRGEELFLQLHPEWKANNIGAHCKEPDFVDRHGRTLELKFDVSNRARRDQDGYQLNFFMETVSNNRKKTVGGVFRAEQEGVDFLVYMFEAPFRIFVLDVQRTVETVRRLAQSGVYRKLCIKNHHYWTEGYALPIDMFASCFASLEKRFNKQERALKKLEWTLMN